MAAEAGLTGAKDSGIFSTYLGSVEIDHSWLGKLKYNIYMSLDTGETTTDLGSQI